MDKTQQTDKTREKGWQYGALEIKRLSPIWASEDLFPDDKGAYVLYEDHLKAIQVPIVVWAVERNFKTPEMSSDDWRYFAYPGVFDENEVFQEAWDLALKFHDRNGAEQCCKDFPDDWDVRITDHQLVPPTPPTQEASND